jgi:hypothetical protein
MTAKVDGPSGWVLDVGKGRDQEKQELLSEWMTVNGEALQVLEAILAKALKAADGNSLVIWLTTLRGICGELEGILTAQPVGVVKTDGQTLQ